MKRFKLKEIAEAANVSVSTVSRVLSDSQIVSDSSREAVYTAIGQLNTKRPGDDKLQVRKTILILTSNFSHPVHSIMLEAITKTAHENGYTATVCSSNNRLLSFEALYTLVTDTNASGIILLTCAARLKDLEKLSRLLPIVYSGGLPQGSPLSCVSFNYYDLFKELTLQCISLGKKHIGILQLKRYLFTEMPSVAGFMDALKESGLNYDRSLFLMPESFDYLYIYDQLDAFFRYRPRINALLCENDALAIAASSAARKNGYSIPDDILIIASNGTHLSQMCYPPIRAVTLPMDRLGICICEMVMRQIRENSREPEHTYLEY